MFFIDDPWGSGRHRPVKTNEEPHFAPAGDTGRRASMFHHRTKPETNISAGSKQGEEALSADGTAIPIQTRKSARLCQKLGEMRSARRIDPPATIAVDETSRRCCSAPRLRAAPRGELLRQEQHQAPLWETSIRNCSLSS